MVRLIAASFATWLVFGSPALPQPAAKPNPQLEAWRKNLETFRKSPLTFFVAKGEPHSCGESCDRWIAAEGSFDTNAPERLRKFLAVPGREQLPIYFSSRGGSLPHAVEIGLMLRQLGMRAGVARSVPRDCDLRSPAGEKHCEELKRFGSEVAAELVFTNAGCQSACVYALIGAVVRQIAPEAKVGVHSPLSMQIGADGVTLAPPERVARLNELTKRYISEMGVDPNLHVIAMATPNQRIRNLTREEIIQFNIDPREVIETRWAARRTGSAIMIEKSIFEERNRARREYRPSFVQLSCLRRDEIKIEYGRPLVQAEADIPSAIRFAAGSGAIDFPARAANGAALLDRVRSVAVPAALLERMAAEPSIEITETFQPNGKPQWSRQISVSTAGLSDALPGLLPRCRS